MKQLPPTLFNFSTHNEDAAVEMLVVDELGAGADQPAGRHGLRVPRALAAPLEGFVDQGVAQDGLGDLARWVPRHDVDVFDLFGDGVGAQPGISEELLHGCHVQT